MFVIVNPREVLKLFGFVILGMIILTIIISVVVIVPGYKKDRETEQKINELEEKVAKIPYMESENKLIKEDRLMRFIKIRGQLFSTFSQPHISKITDPEWCEAHFGKIRSIVQNLKIALLSAQIEQSMSDKEYFFIFVFAYYFSDKNTKSETINGEVIGENECRINRQLIKKYEHELTRYAMPEIRDLIIGNIHLYF